MPIICMSSIRTLLRYIRILGHQFTRESIKVWNAHMSTLAHTFTIYPVIYQSWSRGRAITTPKMETSNNNHQTGKDCFLRLFNSFRASIFFNSAFAPCFSNNGLKSPLWVGADVSCSSLGCSAASRSSYLSKYSGNTFLNVGLLWKNKKHEATKICKGILKSNVLPKVVNIDSIHKGLNLFILCWILLPHGLGNHTTTIAYTELYCQ